MKITRPDITIILPCYNTPPNFLSEALDSIYRYAGKYTYDIIIVNDGSTNSETLQYLDKISTQVKVVKQQNKGLSGARNSGVQLALSKYLLFLDGDDRIKPEYIESGLNILKTKPQVGVVYAKAELFGDNSRPDLPVQAFNITELLLQNHIPSCAVIRKKVWEDTGGFDENMRRFEDWEFWIRVYKAHWGFEFIDTPLFEYRIHQQSLLGTAASDDFRKALAYIYKKHWDLVYEMYHHLYATRIIYQNDIQKPLRSFLKYLNLKWVKKKTTIEQPEI